MWNRPNQAKRRVVKDGGTSADSDAGAGVTMPVDSRGGPADGGGAGAPAAIQARMISFSCAFSGPAFAPLAGMSSSRIRVHRYDFSGSWGTTHSRFAANGPSS